MAVNRCQLNAKSCGVFNAKLAAARAFLAPSPRRPLGDVEKAGQTLGDILSTSKDHEPRHIIAHGFMVIYGDLCVSFAAHLQSCPTADTHATRLEAEVHALLAVQNQLVTTMHPPDMANFDEEAAAQEIGLFGRAGMLEITVALCYCMTRIPFDGAYTSQLCSMLAAESQGKPDGGVCEAIVELFNIMDYRDAFSHDSRRSMAELGIEHTWERLAGVAAKILGNQTHAHNESVTRMASFLVRHSERVPECESTTLMRFVYGLARHYNDHKSVPPADFPHFGAVVRLVRLTKDTVPKDGANLVISYVESAMMRHRGDYGLIPGKWGYDLARLAMQLHAELPHARDQSVRAGKAGAIARLLNICVVRCNQSQKLFDFMTTPAVVRVLLQYGDEVVAVGLARLLSQNESVLKTFMASKGPEWVTRLALTPLRGKDDPQHIGEMSLFDNGLPILTLLVRNVEHGSIAAVAQSLYARRILSTHLTAYWPAEPFAEWRVENRKWAHSAMLVDFIAQSEEGCRAIASTPHDLHLRLIGVMHLQFQRQYVESAQGLVGDISDMLTAWRHTVSVLVSAAFYAPVEATRALTQGFDANYKFADELLVIVVFLSHRTSGIDIVFETCYAVAPILQAALSLGTLPLSEFPRRVLKIVNLLGRALVLGTGLWPGTYYSGSLCLSILYEYFPDIMRDAPDVRIAGEKRFTWNDTVECYCTEALDDPNTSPEVAQLASDVRKEIHNMS